jgi:hypothetical protein
MTEGEGEGPEKRPGERLRHAHLVPKVRGELRVVCVRRLGPRVVMGTLPRRADTQRGARNAEGAGGGVHAGVDSGPANTAVHPAGLRCGAQGRDWQTRWEGGQGMQAGQDGYKLT